jgi:hypothetical protein
MLNLKFPHCVTVLPDIVLNQIDIEHMAVNRGGELVEVDNVDTSTMVDAMRDYLIRNGTADSPLA